MFALLVPSCCDKSGTSCYHLVTRLMTVTDLLQVVPTRLIQAVHVTSCYELVVINLLRADDIRLVGTTIHAKISHLVVPKISYLPTSRQQVVFALLVPSRQQVWNKLLTTCNNLVDIIRLVARLFQQVRYNHDIIILLQSCVINLVTFLLYHDCIRLVGTTL